MGINISNRQFPANTTTEAPNKLWIGATLLPWTLSTHTPVSVINIQPKFYFRTRAHRHALNRESVNNSNLYRCGILECYPDVGSQTNLNKWLISGGSGQSATSNGRSGSTCTVTIGASSWSFDLYDSVPYWTNSNERNISRGKLLNGTWNNILSPMWCAGGWNGSSYADTDYDSSSTTGSNQTGIAALNSGGTNHYISFYVGTSNSSRGYQNSFRIGVGDSFTKQSQNIGNGFIGGSTDYGMSWLYYTPAGDVDNVVLDQNCPDQFDVYGTASSMSDYGSR